MKKEQFETLYIFTKQNIALRWGQIHNQQEKIKAITEKMGFSDALELLAEGQIEKIREQAAALEGNKEYRDANRAISEHGLALYSMIILQAFLNSDKAKKGYRAYKLEKLADKAIEMYVEFSKQAEIEPDSQDTHNKEASWRYTFRKTEEKSEVEENLAIFNNSIGIQADSEATIETYRAAIKSAIIFVFSLPAVGAEETAVAREGHNIAKEVIKNTPLEQVLFPTSKVNRYLTKIQEDNSTEGQLQLIVSPRNAKKQVCIDVAMYTNPNITGVERLTEFDKIVANSVYTIFSAGLNAFSVEQVYKVMTGAKNQTSVTDRAMLEKIDKSLEHLRATNITINCEQQQKLQSKSLKAKYTDYLLPMAHIEGEVINESNGKPIKSSCYKLHTAPPIYAYAKELNQIQSFSGEVNKIPINNSENIMMLKWTLLGRIALAYSKGHIASISYNNLYSEAGITINNKMQRTRLKEAMLRMLDYWKSIKVVKGYKEYSINGKIAGLEFSVYPKEQHNEIE